MFLPAHEKRHTRRFYDIFLNLVSGGEVWRVAKFGVRTLAPKGISGSPFMIVYVVMKCTWG